MTEPAADPTTAEPGPAQDPPEAAPPEAPPQDTTDWRAEARKWETRAKENKTAATKLAEIEAANATDLEKAVAAARAETSTEVMSKANHRLVASEARALAAAANFHNPADVVGLVDLSTVEVNEDGDVDSDAVTALIKDLVKERPYLVKTAEEAKPKVKPDHSQGPRGNGGGSNADQFAAALGPLFT